MDRGLPAPRVVRALGGTRVSMVTGGGELAKVPKTSLVTLGPAPVEYFQSKSVSFRGWGALQLMMGARLMGR